ncbi:MAG: sterol desaturase family protein [Chitinophagaceae bacterium]|jgi:sterol desaturase/sphingolipid hydroxylase (fatty acid hydroxylase superfamily)|nr:sterol desaturase family protein [Chitinophagaceae bacterium]MCF8289191.1 sterol desaturase family protein [Chitinophagaceae bacterium]MCF8422561.1 sterol desaturase family protein [Chitinophagaceae bacterium]
METYGKILIIAMPLFLLLVLLEKWYGWRKGNDTVRTMDMISSLSSGVTNSTKDVLGLSLAIISYSWLVENLTIYQVQSSWLLYVIAFLALDFAGYWVHRLAHTVNFFWNNHIVHHSSEEFNLACALRQSISVYFRIYAFLLIPAALFGVPQQVIAVVAPLHLFAQFWYHTQHIHKMGWLEYIIVTPAHHRVHHAINPEYLDKNYGQIFIFWDRMFGTFQEESPAIPAVYGVTRPVRTWNPIKINFMHLWLLMQDAWHTKSWKDKLRVWLMPLGWRPADVVEKYPVYKIEDVYHFEKYDTPAPKGMIIYLWIQLFCLLLIVSYLFGNVASIGLTNMMYYGLFIFAQVYALTEFMDRNPRALIYEVVKNMICVGGILYYGGWFGLQNYFGASSYILMGYFVASTATVAAYTSQLTRPLNHSRTLS